MTERTTISVKGLEALTSAIDHRQAVIEELRADNARLRKALKPLADYYPPSFVGASDASPLVDVFWTDGDAQALAVITIGDVRRARAALEGKG